MLRLETFGRLALLRDAAEAAAIPRRRLSLLAVLAAAGDRGLSRDKVVALFWPESSSDNARHSLEQLVYALRRQLGDTLFLGSDPLRLNPDAITCDLWEFRRALKAGAAEEAVALVGGPFLDGFYLNGSGDFERWAEEERQRIQAAVVDALESLAEVSRTRGDSMAVVTWRRRLAAADPLSGRAALALMRAQCDAGDRIGALQHARVYEALLRQELDSEPDREILELTAQLRALDQDGRPPRGEGVSDPQADVAPPPPPLDDAPGRPLPAGMVKRPPIVRRLGAAAGVLLPLILGLTVAHDDPGAARIATRRILLVSVAGPVGDSVLAAAGRALPELLAARLAESAGLDPVEDGTVNAAGSPGTLAGMRATAEAARRLGASRWLTVSVSSLGGSHLSVGAVLGAPRGGPVVRMAVKGTADSLGELADRIAVAVMLAEAGEPTDRLPFLNAESSAALQPYLAARDAVRQGRYSEAVALLARDVTEHPGFATAGLELAEVAARRILFRPIEPATTDRGWPIEADSAWSLGLAVARAGSGQLGATDRVLLAQLAGMSDSAPTTALAQLLGWERTAQAAPDRAEVWYRFGALLLVQGGAVGESSALARAEAAFRRARELDPDDPAPVLGLLEVAAERSDTAAVRLLADAYLARAPGGDLSDYVRWRAAALLGDGPTLGRIRARVDSLSPASLAAIVWTSQTSGMRPADGALAAAAMLRRAGTRLERMRACTAAELLAINRGRPREGRALIDRTLTLDQQPYCSPAFWVLYGLYWDGDTADARRAADELTPVVQAVLNHHDIHPADRDHAADLFVMAQWAFWQGNPGVAHATVLRLRELASDPELGGWARPRVELLETLVASTTGAALRPGLTRLDSLARQGCCLTPHYLNLVLARLWEQAGDTAAALRAARRARWYFAPEYLSAALRAEGRLADASGERTEALDAYRHLLALQSDPEPDRAAPLERVRARALELARAPR